MALLCSAVIEVTVRSRTENEMSASTVAHPQLVKCRETFLIPLGPENTLKCVAPGGTLVGKHLNDALTWPVQLVERVT